MNATGQRRRRFGMARDPGVFLLCHPDRPHRDTERGEAHVQHRLFRRAGLLLLPEARYPRRQGQHHLADDARTDATIQREFENIGEVVVRLKTDDPIPIRDVHVDSIELAGKQHTVMSYEISRLFQFVHSLLKPMLGGDDALEELPFLDNDF